MAVDIGRLSQLLVAPVHRTSGRRGDGVDAAVADAVRLLRKELALQLLVALAVIQYGAGAATLNAILSPAQLFVFALVTAISMPCAATFATLVGEFGGRSALSIGGGSLALALGAGAVLARLSGIA